MEFEGKPQGHFERERPHLPPFDIELDGIKIKPQPVTTHPKLVETEEDNTSPHHYDVDTQRAILNAEFYWGTERPRVMGPRVRESSYTDMGRLAMFDDEDEELEPGTRRLVYRSDGDHWSLTIEDGLSDPVIINEEYHTPSQ